MDGFSKLYSLHYAEIFSYILKLSKDKYIAEDVAQETFIKAFEYIITNKSIFNKSWLYKVSFNLFIDKTRRAKNVEYKDELKEPLSIEYIPHEEFEKKEEREKIQSILDLLPLIHKNILILREYKELSYEEIGEILEMKVSNVKSNIFRARQRFRRLYKELEEKI